MQITLVNLPLKAEIESAARFNPADRPDRFQQQKLWPK
jgi:hypothetical protein